MTKVLLLTHNHSENNSRDAAANESLPRLLGTQLNKGSLAKEEAKHVRHNVIDDYH